MMLPPQKLSRFCVKWRMSATACGNCPCLAGIPPTIRRLRSINSARTAHSPKNMITINFIDTVSIAIVNFHKIAQTKLYHKVYSKRLSEFAVLPTPVRRKKLIFCTNRTVCFILAPIASSRQSLHKQLIREFRNGWNEELGDRMLVYIYWRKCARYRIGHMYEFQEFFGEFLQHTFVGQSIIRGK